MRDIMALKGGNTVRIKIFIGENTEDEILIYARERTELVDKIERLVLGADSIVAKKDRVSYNIELSQVVCFAADDNKVFVHTSKEKFEIDKKIYELEMSLPENFIKINKSCIANIDKISSFDATVGGTLAVKFKNGERDYVSRRRIKHVKERLMRK